LKDVFRPGQGDFTYQQKYGVRDWRGGGRASGGKQSPGLLRELLPQK